MQRINAVRFAPVPEISNLNGELFVHAGGNAKHIFPDADNYHFDRVLVRRQGEAYQICYTRRPAQQFWKSVFTLEKNQYGRIIYNARATNFDGDWQYQRMVINFLHADESAFRPKMFFRKEPDYLFQDLDYLFYCGEYHERRTRNETLSAYHD